MGDIEPDNKKIKKRRKSDQVRLESWKAIANHLSRSVRTVRRWEATEKLPVHRHRHTKGFSVYAFRCELDAWQSDHQGPLTDTSESLPNGQQQAAVKNRGRVAALLIVALIVGGVADRYVLSVNQAPDSSLASRLSQRNEVAYWPESDAQVLVAPVFSAWADGRIHDAFRDSRNVAQQLPRLPPEIQEFVIDYLVVFSLNLGRVADARSLMKDLPEGVLRNTLDARIALAAGDMTRVAEVLKDGQNSAMLSPAQSDVFLAMAAMNFGNLAEAKARLQSATSELVVEDQGYFFVALDLLAGVLKSEGDLLGAVSVLERTAPQRHAAARNRSGLFWLMCQRQLANLYREAGWTGLADKLENELQNWLIFADEDFPLALSLADA